ncbi:MAG: Kae1-associated kinase Bud32 [Thaumarchaeota archaeon]|nr:Kae1-associated kinase Bud32 [Nitrososphaerota archaeon]
MKLVYQGAEADVYSGEWSGQRAVFKFRKALPYRLPELDRVIRSQRTAHEAELLHESKKAGIRNPTLYYVSAPESLIVMEEVIGPRLKTVLESGDAKTKAVSEAFGNVVGRLHASGIMHGDLTTSNVIVNGDGVNLIDFGLAVRSTKLEDHAVDLRLIKETLIGAHSTVASAVMKAFLEGYAGVVGEARAKQVSKKLAEIERRGRYARVE